MIYVNLGKLKYGWHTPYFAGCVIHNIVTGKTSFLDDFNTYHLLMSINSAAVNKDINVMNMTSTEIIDYYRLYLVQELKAVHIIQVKDLKVYLNTNSISKWGRSIDKIKSIAPNTNIAIPSQNGWELTVIPKISVQKLEEYGMN